MLAIFFLISPRQALAEDAPTLKEKKTQEGFVLNLKELIEKSKKKIEKVNEKIDEQARRRRNLQREEKAREYYLQAERLMDQEKYEAARKLLEKAVKITEHPEMKDYVSESVSKYKRQKKAFEAAEEKQLKQLELERGYSAREVRKEYGRAVALFKGKEYLEARAAFEHVEEMFPDHKATRSYLAIIDQEIQKEQERLIKEKLQEQAEVREKEKLEWREQLAAKERERKQKNKEMAASLYRDAIKLYKTRQFEKAKDKFKEVEWVLPNYKSTVRYLSRIDRDIEKENRRRERDREQDIKQKIASQKMKDEKTRQKALQTAHGVDDIRQKRLEEEAEFLYRAAVNLYKQREYEAALSKFIEVQGLLPAYKSSEKYTRRLQKKIEAQRVKEAEEEYAASLKEKKPAPKATDPSTASRRQYGNDVVQEAVQARTNAQIDKAEARYKKALAYYKQKSFHNAKVKFIEVEALWPGYKDTGEYLARIDEDIRRSGQHEKASAFQKSVKSQTMVEVEHEALREEQEAREALEAQERLRSKEIYAHAKRLYKSKLYEDAKEQFLKVSPVSRKHRAAAKYVRKIDEILTRQKETARADIPVVSTPTKEPASYQNEIFQEPLVDAYASVPYNDEAGEIYHRAISLYRADKLSSAEQHFNKVLRLIPDYKNTAKYLDVIERKLKKQAKQSVKEEAPQTAPQPRKQGTVPVVDKPAGTVSVDEDQEEIENLYKAGVKSYRDGDYILSRDYFLSVYRLDPHYKSVAKYIDTVKTQIKKGGSALPHQMNALQEEISQREKLVKAETSIFEDTTLSEGYFSPGERYAVLKAQEEYHEYVQEKEGEEFLEKIEKEKLGLEKSKKKRRDRIEDKKKEVLNKLKEDARELEREKRVLEKVERRKQAERLKQLKKERAEEEREFKRARKIQRKKDKEEQERLRRQKIEEEKKLKELEKEKAQEEKELKRLEALQAKDDKADLKEEAVSSESKKAKATEKIESKKKKRKLTREEKRARREERRRLKKLQKEYKNLKKKQRKIVARESRAVRKAVKKSKRAEQKVFEKHLGKKVYWQDEKLELALRGAYEQMKDKMPSKGTSGKAEKPKDTKEELERVSKEKEEIQKKREEAEALREKKIKEEKEKQALAKKESEEKKRLAREEKEKERLARLAERQERKEKLKAEKEEKKRLREEARQKKIEAEKAKLEKEKEAREKKLEEEKKKKEEETKKREEAQREKERIERIKWKVGETYKDAVMFFKEKNYPLSKEKALEGQALLKEEGLSLRYVQKMERKVKTYLRKIEERVQAEKRRQEDIQRREEERLAAEKAKLEAQKQKELARLEEKIKEEERRLALEKEQEEKRLAAEHKKLERANQAKEPRVMEKEGQEKAPLSVSEPKPRSRSVRRPVVEEITTEPMKNILVDRTDVLSRKREELERLFAQRQEELRKERERLRNEFAKNLEVLYDRALDLFRQGKYGDSQRLFVEIDAMEPDYKKTRDLLNKINKTLSDDKIRPRGPALREVVEESSAQGGQEYLKELDPLKDRQKVIRDALDNIESQL